MESNRREAAERSVWTASKPLLSDDLDLVRKSQSMAAIQSRDEPLNSPVAVAQSTFNAAHALEIVRERRQWAPSNSSKLL